MIARFNVVNIAGFFTNEQFHKAHKDLQLIEVDLERIPNTEEYMTIRIGNLKYYAKVIDVCTHISCCGLDSVLYEIHLDITDIEDYS